MPTVLRSGPYRVYFFSHEPNEPPHVHVDRDDQSAKFWLDPVGLGRYLGFSAHELKQVEALIRTNEQLLLEACVAISEPRAGERIVDVKFDENTLSARLADGRIISVPLVWFPRLLHATPEQREKWVLSGAGYGIHWPDLDEDLSSEGLLRGAPAPAKQRPSAA